MGYDPQHFVEAVHEEFICKICKKVLEHPLEVAECEHNFCRRCIEGHSHCPVDGNECNSATLGPAPKILKRMLSNLKMRCINASHGCGVMLPLENMEAHLMDCGSNPFNQALPAVCECKQCANKRLGALLMVVEIEWEKVLKQGTEAIEGQEAPAMCESGMNANQENASGMEAYEAMEADVESLKQESDEAIAIENQDVAAAINECTGDGNKEPNTHFEALLNVAEIEWEKVLKEESEKEQ